MIGPTLTIVIAALIAVIFIAERARPGLVTAIEENAIAALLALITLISFVQVILRYGFNTGINGALELTTVLFAWLILFGMSYGIKMGMHLGVDAFIRLLPPRAFKAVAIFGAVCCLLYGLILLNADWLQWLGAKTRGGAVDYWSKMFKLGIGMEDMRWPGFLQALGLPRARASGGSPTWCFRSAWPSSSSAAWRRWLRSSRGNANSSLPATRPKNSLPKTKTC